MWPRRRKSVEIAGRQGANFSGTSVEDRKKLADRGRPRRTRSTFRVAWREEDKTTKPLNDGNRNSHVLSDS